MPYKRLKTGPQTAFLSRALNLMSVRQGNAMRLLRKKTFNDEFRFETISEANEPDERTYPH